MTLEEKVTLAHDTISLWSRGGAYPNPGTDVLRLPFSFTLPAEQLPPSFKFQSSWQWAHVKYSVTAVGARKGRLTPNRRHRVPFAVLPRDEAGTALRLGDATHAWRRFDKEDSIRKGLWGDYSKVHVEVRLCPTLHLLRGCFDSCRRRGRVRVRVQLALPDIPVLPLFSDIPYKITVTTTSAPLAREKAHADKDKGKGTTSTFPPPPRDPHELEFELEQRLQLRADIFKGREGKASHTVATILGGKKEKEKGTSTKIDIELPEREWVPLGAALVSDGKEKEKERAGGDGAGKGSWVQRATFQSTFRLNCPPAFAVQNIDCNVRLPPPLYASLTSQCGSLIWGSSTPSSSKCRSRGSATR